MTTSTNQKECCKVIIETSKLAEHLEAVGRLMELNDENPHKVRAYMKAATLVRSCQISDLRIPAQLPGVGPSIGKTITEFLSTGSSKKLQVLSEKWPVEMLSLMKVQGIGPKGAASLFSQGISSYEELLEKARSGLLSSKMTQNVLAADKQNKRVPIEVASTIAEEIKSNLLRAGAKRAEVCGSVRRHLSTCKDIDLIVEVETEKSLEVKKAFENLGRVLWSGPTKSSISIVSEEVSNIQCDLWIVNEWHWGAALNYTTGNKNHNQRLRSLVKTRGGRLNEYGVFLPLSGENFDVTNLHFKIDGAFIRGRKIAERIGGTQEKDVYDFLEIPYVYPSQRSE